MPPTATSTARLSSFRWTDRGRAREVVLKPEREAYADWRVATTLPRVSGEALEYGRFQAKDYDELIDCPVEMGTFMHARFEARGILYEVALTGVFDDIDRLCADLTVICTEHLSEWASRAIWTAFPSGGGNGYGVLDTVRARA